MHKKCSKIASEIMTPRSLLPSSKLPGIFPVHYKQNLRVPITFKDRSIDI